MKTKMILICGILFSSTFLQACATGLPEMPMASCVADRLAPISMRGRERFLPDLSHARVITEDHIRRIVASMPQLEKRRARSVTRAVAAKYSKRTSLLPSDYIMFHDEIYDSFANSGADVYDVNVCGERKEVGQQVFVVVSDWLMSSYGDPGSWQRLSPSESASDGQGASHYDASSVLRTAVMLQINGLPYQFSILEKALPIRGAGSLNPSP